MRYLSRPFRDRAVHARVVNFLKGISPNIARRNVTDKEQERHTILLRRVHGDGSVAGARPTTDARDAWHSCKTRIGQRHESSARFVPTNDCIYGLATLVQRIKEAQVAFTGHTKYAIDIIRDEAIGYELTGGQHKSAIIALAMVQNQKAVRIGVHQHSGNCSWLARMVPQRDVRHVLIPLL